MFCYQCGKQNENMAKFCFQCGVKLKIDHAEEGKPESVTGAIEELDHYVLKAQGISRTALNVMCLIGVFIFGWLLAMVFDQLGKKGMGWFYLVPIIIILVVSFQGAGEVGIIAPIIYVIGWIHANLILSRYESLAGQRIAEIEQNQTGGQTADDFLEKGLLKSKVLRQTEPALADFGKALQLPGGDPQLLNLAGVQYSAASRFREAGQFFERALETATEENLVKQIKQNQAFAEKRLK